MQVASGDVERKKTMKDFRETSARVVGVMLAASDTGECWRSAAELLVAAGLAHLDSQRNSSVSAVSLRGLMKSIATAEPQGAPSRIELLKRQVADAPGVVEMWGKVEACASADTVRSVALWCAAMCGKREGEIEQLLS